MGTATVHYATTPPTTPPTSPPTRPTRPRQRAGRAWAALALPALILLYLVLAGTDLPQDGRNTLVVFAAAVLAWMFSGLDDTYIGLAAAVTLVLIGAIGSDSFFAALGGETVWLLIAAFVLAHGLTRTGLPTRFAILLCGKASTVRGLAHLTTAALIVTAVAVPSTSGRAALALPVFLALAAALADRPAVVRAFALLFPTVVLLSAVATLIGAGAHLISNQLLTAATGDGIGYAHWLLLGLPFAVVSSHLAAEIVLLLMTSQADRRQPLHLDRDQLATTARTGIHGPLSPEQARALGILGATVTLWCTEALHGLSPALVALLGALLISAPKLGSTKLGEALCTVPWSLLMFMVSTAVLGMALSSSGAARWLGAGMFDGIRPEIFLAAVVAVSAGAHLVLQSRSARSSVLVPLLIPLASAFGMDPASVVFASTVAAGFCHTLPSSAKPVAMFAAIQGVPTYRRSDLVRLSAFVGPAMVALVLTFAVAVWPQLGLPTH